MKERELLGGHQGKADYCSGNIDHKNTEFVSTKVGVRVLFP